MWVICWRTRFQTLSPHCVQSTGYWMVLPFLIDLSPTLALLDHSECILYQRCFAQLFIVNAQIIYEWKVYEPQGHYTKWNKSSREKHKYCVISLICGKKKKPIDTKSKLGVAHGWVRRRNGEMLVKIQTLSYKMKKFSEYNMQCSDCSYQYCIIHVKVAKRLDLWWDKYSHQKKKKSW